MLSKKGKGEENLLRTLVVLILIPFSSNIKIMIYITLFFVFISIFFVKSPIEKISEEGRD